MNLGLNRLRVLRPAAVDLVLTQMARGDAEDLADIRFLLDVEPLTEGHLMEGFRLARVPPVPEIKALFAQSQPKVLFLARDAAARRNG